MRVDPRSPMPPPAPQAPAPQSAAPLTPALPAPTPLPPLPAMPPRFVVAALMGLVGLLERLRRALLPPELYLMDTALFGGIRSYAILNATRLGLFDALRHGPLAPGEVAARIGTEADATRRLLRALASYGILDGDGPRYALNAASRLLLPEAQTGFGAGILLNADPRQYVAWSRLAEAMRGDASPFELSYGAPFFEQLGRDREMGETFDRAMRGWSLPTMAAVCAAWAPPKGARIVDVGGGHGHMLTTILDRNPGTTGVLFDLPHVVSGAAFGALAERVTAVPGSFFEAVPAGGDVYLLMNILHDWGDDDSTRILRACRAAMGPGARLLVIDILVPEGNPVGHPGPIVDLLMLTLFREGRERTEAELRALAAAADLEVERVIPTAVPNAIVVLKVPDQGAGSRQIRTARP